MITSNRLLDLYEAPQSLTDLLHIAVAHSEEHVWNNKNRFVYLGMLLEWDDSVSNSHDSPRNGVTNWAGKDTDAPKGYPGWYGRIWLATARPTEFITWDSYRGVDRADISCSRAVKRCGIYTGTGGGGTYNLPPEVSKAMGKPYKDIGERYTCYGYTVRIFSDDWPSIRLAEMLANTSSKTLTHYWYINKPPRTDRLPTSKHQAIPIPQVPKLTITAASGS